MLKTKRMLNYKLLMYVKQRNKKEEKQTTNLCIANKMRRKKETKRNNTIFALTQEISNNLTKEKTKNETLLI